MKLASSKFTNVSASAAARESAHPLVTSATAVKRDEPGVSETALPPYLKGDLGMPGNLDAISFGGLGLVMATGLDPTGGYLHWFEPFPGGEEFAFMTRTPSGFVSQVMTPYSVKRPFALSAAQQNVRIHHADSAGRPTYTDVPIRAAQSLFERDVISNASPISIHLVGQDTPDLMFDKRGLPIWIMPGIGKTSNVGVGIALDGVARIVSGRRFETVIASFESPEICSCDVSWDGITCKNPHYTAKLIIEAVSDQDLERIVRSCLETAAVVAAVAAVAAALATGGAAIAAAKSAFLSALKVCLIDKVDDVVSIDLDVDRECR